MRRLTFGYLNLYGSSQIEVIEAAAAAGFRSVGLRLEGRRTGDSFPHHVLGNRQQLREIKKRLADLDVFPSNVTGRSFDPETGADQLAAVVDAGAELGCSYILVNGHDPDEHRTTENIARLAAHAADAGLKIAVEFVPFHCIRDLPQALRIVTGTGADNIGLVIDALHLNRSGGRPDDIAGIAPGLIVCGQVCDAPAEAPKSLDACLAESRSGRLYPGDGGLPLNAFIANLPKDCEIEVEVPHAGYEGVPLQAHAARIAASLGQLMRNH